MLGAIIGDIIGSKYEFNNIKTKQFPLFSEGCGYTDDTIMTIAVARAIVYCYQNKQLPFSTALIQQMQALGKKFPHPRGGYGMRFSRWLTARDPQPYNSFGNGSAMRVSPCGLFAVTLPEAMSLAKASAEVTHNHPEGIKGAQAVAAAIFLAREGKQKEEIADFIRINFYDLDQSLDDIRDSYLFNESCQGTVPQAITAFLESCSFEDAIRNAVSLGGDCDTLTAITGSIAWAYYRPTMYAEMESIGNTALKMLPAEFRETIAEFTECAAKRRGAFARIGLASGIAHKPAFGPEEHFLRTPATVALGSGQTLREIIAGACRNRILEDFCSTKRHVEILWEHGIGIYNYNLYPELCNQISQDHTLLHTATLEDCLIYLTYLWRLDYASGGYPDFDHQHRHSIRAARMRIVNLLS